MSGSFRSWNPTISSAPSRTVISRSEGKSPESTRVADIASRELVTIDPDQDVDEAMRLMSKHQVRRLPVVEEDGKFVGIVAQADIAKHVAAAQTGEVVEKISK